MVLTDLQILPLAFANGLIQLVGASEDPLSGGAQDRSVGKPARLIVVRALFPAVSAI